VSHVWVWTRLFVRLSPNTVLFHFVGGLNSTLHAYYVSCELEHMALQSWLITRVPDRRSDWHFSQERSDIDILDSGLGTAIFIPVGALALFLSTTRQQEGACSVAVGVRKWPYRMSVQLFSRQIGRNEHSVRSCKKG
jgi:hypothetical protein